MKFIYALRKTKAKECNNNRARTKDQEQQSQEQCRTQHTTHKHTFTALAKSQRTIKMECQGENADGPKRMIEVLYAN